MNRRILFFVSTILFALFFMVTEYGKSYANQLPNISITPDSTVLLESHADSVKIWILASDPDPGDTITTTKVLGEGTYIPKTEPSTISDNFYFRPDTNGVYMFVMQVRDKRGTTNQDTTYIAVSYNLPPQLTCPATQNHHINGNYTISQVVADDDSTVSSLTATFTGGGVANFTLTNIQGIGAKHATADFNYDVTNHCAAGGFVVVIAIDNFGAADTCFFGINLSNAPPVLTCPSNGSVHAGNKFTSGNYSVTDPDGDTAPVTFLGIIPSATHNPTIVGSHVEWNTTCAEKGDYTIKLLATDPCGYKDTCLFTVNVYNQPPILTCPSNGNVHSGHKFTSTDFSVTDPDGDAAPVTFVSITPSATNNPTIVGSHIEWNTTCAEKGNYTIKLLATDPCGLKDTCEFTVNVYNQPPVLTCPSDGSVRAGYKFTSTNYSVTDPESDPTTISLMDITPTPINPPALVNSHVEWLTSCSESGIYTIRLLAADSCGAKDTCSFQITVTNVPPEITCPDSMAVHTGHYSSGNFHVNGSVGDTIVQVGGWVTPSGTGITNLTVLGGIGVTPTTGHVEFDANCSYPGLYVISLEVTDKCGLKDTCTFQVRLYERPPQLTCPSNGSVHSGHKFTSTDFSVTDPDGDAAPVTFVSITPSATNNPTIVGSHIEWNTTCAENGDYTISLLATDPCGYKDTCLFTVNVYNQPPVLTCPSDGSVRAGYKFTSTNYSVTDPESDPTTVSFFDITPPATNTPTLVNSHVEWLTSCSESGIYTIRLLAADSCGAKDTCSFQITVTNVPPEITCPDSMAVHTGHYSSGNFHVNGSVGDTIVQVGGWVTPSGTGITNLTVLGGIGVTPTTGHVEFDANCSYPGLYVISLEVTDKCGLKDTCTFQVRLYERPPQLTCPSNGSVHAGNHFTSTDFSVTDPDGDAAPVTFVSITPSATNNPTIVGSHIEWNTTCAENGDYTISLLATDPCGYKDTCLFTVNVYNQPPVLTCPSDGSVRAGYKFTSTNYSVTDPESDPTTVTFLGITPGATNNPTVVNSHVEWNTTCAENGNYVISLLATDSCGAKDTCQFTVNVYNQPPQLTCPANGSIHADNMFTSTNFSVTDPDGDTAPVTFLSIIPSATNNPTIVGNHVEWNTTCAEKGDYVIKLLATDPCGLKDTCEFTVNVYNQPPVLTCPDDGVINAPQTFISSDFSATDPDGDNAPVTFLDITPTAANNPTIVGSHVEWVTTYAEYGEYIIRLIATDPCGLKDTCQFKVTVFNEHTGEFTCPDNDSVHAGVMFVSTNYSVSGPGANPDSVRIISITPAPGNQPIKVLYHVEWQTGCADTGKVFTICMEAKDNYGDFDTCCFLVTVYNRSPQLTCPSNGSVHSGNKFTSGDFSVTDPDGDAALVTFLSITPTPTNNPTMVNSHLEWNTTCAENGNYIIRLLATDPCGLKDTCEFTVNVYNQPPVLTCPNNGSVHAGQKFTSTDYSVTDPENDPTIITFLSIVPGATNSPTIVGSHVEWSTTCAENGNYTIRLVAADVCGLKDTCEFTVNIYNHPPQITCPINGTVDAGLLFGSTNFAITDQDGDQMTTTITSIVPPAVHNPTIVGNHVEWLTTAGESGNYSITLRVTDACGLTDECSFLVTVRGPSGGEITHVWIEEVDSCVNPGAYATIPIWLTNNTAPFGGFEIEVEFDYTSMTFISAEPGPMIGGFEYFTYRLLPCPSCACCKYKILLYGMYDIPNGSGNVGTPIPVGTGVLVYLNFVVNNDENLRGLMIPVCFEWEGTVVNNVLIEDWDCNENTFSSVSGDTLFTSSMLCQFRADLCDAPTGGIQPVLVFQDCVCGDNCGGILVCPAGPSQCKRGDVNYNTLPYEVADAVLFARYFAEGLGVFTDPTYQICATDVNADGRTLTLSDLVYLIRVILHDAVEIPKLAPSTIANVVVYNGVITVEGANVGAILFEFDGAVNPTLLAANMEMVNKDNKVLVWSRTGNSIENAAEVLSYTGDAKLTSVTAVDRDTRVLTTTITSKVAPTTFALHQAYPNPFNPFTNLSFTLPEAANYSLKIYNVAGQLVRAYEGTGSTGLNVITWDGKDNSGNSVSSGVYFYKLTCGKFSATEKMVMMK